MREKWSRTDGFYICKKDKPSTNDGFGCIRLSKNNKSGLF